jgi:hypothetical protein
MRIVVPVFAWVEFVPTRARIAARRVRSIRIVVRIDVAITRVENSDVSQRARRVFRTPIVARTFVTKVAAFAGRWVVMPKVCPVHRMVIVVLDLFATHRRIIAPISLAKKSTLPAFKTQIVVVYSV